MTTTMTWPRRRLLLSLLVATSTATLLSGPALAYDENSNSAVNVDASGLALKGLGVDHGKMDFRQEEFGINFSAGVKGTW